MNNQKCVMVPSGAVDEEFTTGYTYPAGDCDIFEAGIHHKQASGDQWQQRIIVYGDSAADAEALRDRVLASLTAAAAPKAEQQPAPDVAGLVAALRSILGWRELRSGPEFPVERVEDIARSALQAHQKQEEKK